MKNDGQGNCIIICAGDFNLNEIEVQEADFVIAADGGFTYCELLGIRPDLVVGDFDSISSEQSERIDQLEKKEQERVCRLAREKDDTDTLYAVKEGLNRGYQNFRIYAGVGGRLEHTLANIQVLLYLKNHGAAGYLMDAEFMCLVAQNEEVVFRREMEGYLSLFSMGERAEGVSISGMKYCLDQAAVRNDFPIGISNEFIGQESRISVQRGSLLLLVRWLCSE